MKLNWFVFWFVLLVISCREKEKKDVIVVESDKTNKSVKFFETDEGDSIFYFKDFDLYSFKGIDRQNPGNLSYPFVKIIYIGDKLIIKAHFNERKKRRLSLFKLNNQWCYHWSHWGDGVTSHFFKVFSDTALYEFRFLRNPYGETQEDKVRPAKFYSISKETKSGNVITEKYFKSYNWGSSDYSDVPPISKISEVDLQKNSQTYIASKREIGIDTITQSYQSYQRVFRDGEYREFQKEGSLSVSKIPLLFKYEFYTRILELGN